jgi:glutaredoxin
MEPVVRPVTLFTQAGCQDSTRVRDCLVSSQVPFVARNVTTDPEAAHALMATGLFATPLVLAGDQAILVTRPRDLVQRLGFVCRCSDDGE